MDTLFSLPIYSYSKAVFAKKYEEHILAIAKHSHYYPFDVEKAKQTARRFEWKKGIWKYNQIIGYLEVFIFGGSLAFRAYLPEEARKMAFSGVKKYLRLVEINGLYIQLIGTNKTIANKLLETIQSIESVRKWNIDYSQFLRFYKSIDYLHLKSKEEDDV